MQDVRRTQLPVCTGASFIAPDRLLYFKNGQRARSEYIPPGNGLQALPLTLFGPERREYISGARLCPTYPGTLSADEMEARNGQVASIPEGLLRLDHAVRNCADDVRLVRVTVLVPGVPDPDARTARLGRGPIGARCQHESDPGRPDA